MASEYILLEYFKRYLREIRGSSESTIKHYQDALKYISKYLIKVGKIENTLYEISDIGELEIIREFLYNDVEFMELNSRGHQMYSSGLNNYYRFALGEDFKRVGKEIKLLDIEVQVTEQVPRSYIQWNRSTIIKKQVLEAAKNECEINKEHQTFIAQSTGKQYMEGHHLIPMKKQSLFNVSLDVYANIVCLCPTCHRLLHYGLNSNKEEMLNRMYTMRNTRFANSGINIS